GLHKLLAPGAWTPYVVGWFADLWPLSLEAFMLANGVAEVLVGAALVGGVYTTLAAAVVAASMAGVVLDVAWVAAASGRFVDVLVRDVGLLALAVGVTLLSARE
ncbi:MAG: DoxX family membrane protein, partial [Halobacteriaceae archaeon]